MVKVITLLGTRPEIIKLSRVIAELEQHTNHILVHTGQNFDFELNEIFYQQLALRRPDHYLEAAGNSAIETISNVLIRFDRVLEKEQPDALLVLGDTNSSLGVISAKRRKIPIFHMEAGNRCFDQRVPEEINRKIVDHVSDINLVFSEHARRYLLAEGVRPETIIKTGSPMKEVLCHYLPDINNSNIINMLRLDTNSFFVVSAHREENVDNPANLADLLASLNQVAETFEMPVVVSAHPHTRNRLEALSVLDVHPLICFLKPVGFFDYVKLQMNAHCVISDSGTITEESSILSFPAITIRQAHERPEGMDEGTLVMSGLKPETVIDAIHVTVANYKSAVRPFRLLSDYDVDNVSLKVVRIILSYIEYVNRTVWRE